MQALLKQYWQGLEHPIGRGRPVECVHRSNFTGSEMLAVEPDVRNQEIRSCFSECNRQSRAPKAIGVLRHHSEQVVADIFDLVMVQKSGSCAGIIVGLFGGVGACGIFEPRCVGLRREMVLSHIPSSFNGPGWESV